jgi:uncharacterized LabA/DUF88 family protein
LFDNLHDIADDNPEADARGAITYWLSTNGYRELASELDGIIKDSSQGQTDAGAGVDSETVDAAQAAADAAAQKPTESLNHLRRLAGL